MNDGTNENTGTPDIEQTSGTEGTVPLPNPEFPELPTPGEDDPIDPTDESTEEEPTEDPEDTTEDSSEDATEDSSEDATEDTSEDATEDTSEDTTGDASEDTTGDASEDITGEHVEVPAPTEVPEYHYGTLTWSLLGISVALAIAVVIQAILLFTGRRRKGKMKTAVVPAIGDVEVGKLHCQGARESQQDSFGVSPAELVHSHGLLAVVADGMGGLANGDRVSQAAVAVMLDGFFASSGAAQDVLLELTLLANRQVNQLLGSGGIGKSGSTLVAGLVRDQKFHYICIGDSRICLFRNGQLIQLNREHIYRHELSIQAMNGTGTLQSAAAHSNGGGLTSYLGMGNLKYVDIPAQPVQICAGDKFILMSDGVYNALSEEELCGALTANAEQAADKIRNMIGSKNLLNQDNYTAVVLSF